VNELRSNYDKLFAEKRALEVSSNDILEQTKQELTLALSDEKQAAEELSRKQQANHADELKHLQEALKNMKIDLDAANEKLSEGLKDYKNSIAKFKVASNQRSSKLKKKLAKAARVLTLLREVLYESEEGGMVLGSLLANLAIGEKAKNNQNNNSQKESPQAEAETDEQEVELDEASFQRLFTVTADALRRAEEMRKELGELGGLRDEVERLREIVKEADEKMVKAEAKFKVNCLNLKKDRLKNDDNLKNKKIFFLSYQIACIFGVGKCLKTGKNAFV